jgi:hypothetical protein
MKIGSSERKFDYIRGNIIYGTLLNYHHRHGKNEGSIHSEK